MLGSVLSWRIDEQPDGKMMEVEMPRTQVQLTEEQNRLLENLSRERHVSKAELVRRAVDLLLSREVPGRSPEARRERALAVVGRFRSGGRDTARRHDEELAEAYE